jgi:hypothetical protein
VKRTYRHGALMTSIELHLKLFPILYCPPTTLNVVQTDSLTALLKKKKRKKEGRKADRQKERKKTVFNPLN